MAITRERFLVLRAIKTLDKKIPVDTVFRDLAIIQLMEKLMEHNKATWEGEWVTTLQAIMVEYQQTNKLPRKKPNEVFELVP